MSDEEQVDYLDSYKRQMEYELEIKKECAGCEKYFMPEEMRTVEFIGGREWRCVTCDDEDGAA